MKLAVIAYACLFLCIHAIAQVDTDRDGLSDASEQKLLETFRPTFLISATDCAGEPASFIRGQTVPTVAAKDGTIYGQVFPSQLGKDLVEIHYYTIWSVDCGPRGHLYDIEHVSALVSVGAAGPKARYWYAGAHEDTLCDISSGARAEAVDAQFHGPLVWSSAGKHALYLRADMCRGGCGADACTNDVKLKAKGAVINIGEVNAPANGAAWVDSPAWILSQKMGSDFTPLLTARLDEAPGDSVITLDGNGGIRGTIHGGEAAINGASVGASDTGNALGVADRHTSSSLGKARDATGRFLKRAWKKIVNKPPAK